jgi:hypothetical protein
LYTRTPAKNRVRIWRHCVGVGRSGHDRTWVGAPFARLRARGLRTGAAAGLGALRQVLATAQP